MTALALVLCTPASASTMETLSGGSTVCAPERFRLADGHTVAGSLCAKHPGSRRVLLITSHGATYNRSYWDWQQNPDVYSFVRNQDAATTVLNIDLLGSGESSHPLSLRLTMQAQASMLHQLVRAMRGRRYERIILVGHSSGSGLITLEASTYHDVDGLIVTGFFHRLAPPPRGLAVPMALWPAAVDPAFVGTRLDPGYLTTRPGARGNKGFYNPATADPAVIAYDDAHKDVVSASHALGFLRIINDKRISRAVNVPVLSLVGNYDAFCDSPACPQASEEPAAWSPAAQLELHLIENAGHDIHLHGAPYAQAEYAYVREWLQRRFR
jgi:pimeloyl-ACP methyl ester carboxylesterase